MGNRRMRRYMVALTLATVMAGSGSLAGPVSAAEFRFNSRPWLDLAMTAGSYVPQLGQAAQALIGPSQLSYSGKLTVLLLGSDWRTNSTGERLDTIMVMAVNPATNPNTISAVSIPRDMARIAIPSQYGGGTYQGKINGMLRYFKNQVGGNRALALQRFKVTIAQLLQINIDYVAITRFGGFNRLVDEVGGVPVYIPAELRDTGVYDKPGWAPGGKFPVGNDVLGGDNAARCYTMAKPINWSQVPECHRAIVYVRSRKGTVGGSSNNDYKRAGRQQKFVADAIKRVVNLGFFEAKQVRTTAKSIPNDFYTDMPTSDNDVLAMFNLLSGATFTRSTVFSPPTYASRIPGTSQNQLKLDPVRTLCNSYFD